MPDVSPSPRLREWFVDPRGSGRRMQVSWHAEHTLAVLSLWHGEQCVATFRLPAADTARLIGLLVDGLAAAAPVPAPPSSREPEGDVGAGAEVIPLADRRPEERPGDPAG